MAAIDLIIICKFTRRMTREKVLAAKSNTSTLTVGVLGLPSTATVDRIAIYSHLKHLSYRSCCMQQFAKDHQKSFNYKWCWAKGAAVYLRKTDTSASLRLRSTNDLANLRACESSLSSHQSSDGWGLICRQLAALFQGWRVAGDG